MPPLVTLVEKLPVKAEAAAKPYDREAFRYSPEKARPVVFQQEQRADGSWLSRWDGRVFRSRMGMDVDHNVALREAWDSGASTWPVARLEAFSEDPANLNAITAGLNRSKGDQDGAWPAPLERCAYVEQVAEVKSEYGLSIDPVEQAAMLNVAHACKG
ncbi:hypothetical protein C6N75_09715 [Streptomyces solincola]|uniref:DUF1524 domain-containing protein n=1 Tax=Streptomyces solincola TaxID=2100817 RepID=A0A2S9PY65_9ACTN|nr:HNH endonuclease [Streptomyces solincola]PRH79352.1 hypothetical protein C6N75_09715 [Streptomyces solincola]